MKRLDDEHSLSELIDFIEKEYEQEGFTDDKRSKFSEVYSVLIRYRILLRHVDAMEEMVEALSYGQDVQDMEVILNRINRVLGMHP